MILTKVGKLSCKFIVFILFLVAFASFFDVKKVEAEETPPPKIIINEVMVDPSCASDSCEWVELYNEGAGPVDIQNWLIDEVKITSTQVIQSHDYLVITKKKSDFLSVWAIDPTKVLEVSISLANSGVNTSIKLENPVDAYIENYNYIKPAGTDYSWEKVDSSQDDNINNWKKGLESGGTPGAENSVSKPLPPPLAPSGISPTNYQTIPFTDQIVFQWKTTDTQPQNFEFILLDQLNPSNIIIDEPDLTSFQYKATNLPPNTYYWQVIASNQTGETASPIYTFTLYNPVYSNAIIINELMPNPSGDETKNEWIELYNNSDEAIDLNGWHLKDLYGSTHDFAIFNIKGTIIGPRQFLLFYRDETNVTLNNDTDSVVLVQPNGKILSQTYEFNQSKTDWSWARKTDGSWSWTTTPTAGQSNIITLPVEEKENQTEITSDAINTIPIEIKTGDYADYGNKLVKVTGKVTSTSGNTFYLDDGSGEVKIYIQEKTGIDKPEMHKNDIFEVVGIVDLYGKTWRILPQNQNDIKLVEEALVVSSTAKTTVKKTKADKVESAVIPTIKKVKAAESSNLDANTVKDTKKTSFWIQLTKAGIGLALILLIILVVKILRRPKPVTIGGHFGDDET